MKNKYPDLSLIDNVLLLLEAVCRQAIKDEVAGNEEAREFLTETLPGWSPDRRIKHGKRTRLSGCCGR